MIATCTLIKKSLARLLRDAAEAQGVTLTSIHVDDLHGGRLMWQLDHDPAVYTAGEMADRLGVRWP